MALLFESLLLDISVGVASLLTLLYVYFTWNFDYWKKRGVTFEKPTPFFGNIKDAVLGKVYESILYKRIYDSFEGQRFVGLFQFREPTLLLRDPDLIKDVMVKNFSSFHDRGIPVDEENQPLSAHLFNLPGPRWRALRVKLTPTFTSGKMKMMYHLMAECSEQLRGYLQEPASKGEELEMREVMAQFTTDIIGTCAFGLEMNSMKDSDSEFRRMGRKVFEATFTNLIRRLTIIFLQPLAKLLNLSLAGKEVDDFFLNAVKETVQYRIKHNIKRDDFMHLLIQLKQRGKLNDEDETKISHDPTNAKDDINMTDNLLAAQAFVFFLAGFETSSTLMSFALYELALNPDIQARAREEVETVLQQHGGKLTYETLQDMPYLDKVISESLRKYPALGTLFRVCTKPYVIPETNITVEEGTRIVIPVFALHHDPKLYPDPQRFDPERFDVENTARRHRFTYLPFGEGPRICIGMRFGLLQAKLGMATLLRDFQFSPSKRTVIPIRYEPSSIVTASKDGIHLKISRRK
ncbi:probable cytochrome P450 6a13 [Anabrus simplex]|uniref:probable cytochrome P450 6a13 n=1 Tax=Anabrus simplex TaxID=316456 RepID=UPI0034DCCEF2